jgi:hypothetical protein
MGRIKNNQNVKTTPKSTNASFQNTQAAQKILEHAEVIDIIIDMAHPDFNPEEGLVIGAVKARTLGRFNMTEDNLEWYHPYLANFFSGYPLIGESIILISSQGKHGATKTGGDEKYYLPPINVWQDVNHNQNPYVSYKEPQDSSEAEDCNPSGQYSSNPGIEKTDEREEIALGKTFVEQDVLPIFPYEGDTILQGRFPASFRFGSTNKHADTGNYWSSEGLNGDAITIISNGHSVPKDSEFHIEDINRDSAVIYFCEGQLIPLLVASDLWDSYGVTFERKDAEQKALDFIQDKEVQKHNLDENLEDEEDSKDNACPEGEVMNEEGDCVPEEEPVDEEFESNTTVTGTVKNCWDADEANGNDKRKLLLKEMVDDLISAGATPEGACGIIGNALAEGAGPICNSAPSKDPGKAVIGALKNLEKWRQNKNGVPITKSNHNAYWNGRKTTEREGNVCDAGCWCGVGAFEVDTWYTSRGRTHLYGPGQKGEYSRYANFQGGVGIIQWTGTRRTKFEIALGIPAYNDGTGGYMWPKTPYGKNGGGKWKNDKLIIPPTDIEITPKPHNREAYNDAIVNATYKGSKPGLNAQLVYCLEEMKSRNPDVYKLCTTSRDIAKCAYQVYAKFETPTSYINGRPGGRNPNGNAGKCFGTKEEKAAKKKCKNKDYYDHSVKKRTENAENTFITWQGFLIPDPPTAPPVSTNTITPNVPVIIDETRPDGWVVREEYKGFNIIEDPEGPDNFNTTYDEPASYYYKVENSFLPNTGLDGIQDKEGFKTQLLGNSLDNALRTNIRSGYSQYHDEAGLTFPKSDPFSSQGYPFAIRAFIDNEIEDFIEMENI